MRTRWVVLLTLIALTVVGITLYGTPAGPALVAWTSGQVPFVSRALLVFLIVASVVRFAILRIEKKRGVLGADAPASGIFGGLIGDLGPLGNLIAESLTAYFAFLSGATMLAVMATGRLTSAVPEIPTEGLFVTAIVMLVLVGVAANATWRVLLAILRSPVLAEEFHLRRGGKAS